MGQEVDNAKTQTTRTKVEGATARRVVLGFACHQAFVLSMFYLGTNQALSVFSATFERADLFGALLCMLLAFVVLRVVSERVRNALLSQPALWCYAGLLIAGVVVRALAGQGFMGVLAESVLIGVPSGWMLAAWGRALGLFPVSFFIPAVFVASAVGAALCLAVAIVDSLGVDTSHYLCVLLPLGSAFALRGLLSQRVSQSSDSSSLDKADVDSAIRSSERAAFSLGSMFATKEQRDVTARLSRKIVGGTLVFGLAAGFMETFGSQPGIASVPAIPATLILTALFCIAALQLLVTGGLEGDVQSAGAGPAEGPLNGVYRLAILVTMAGFLFVPVLSTFGVTGEAIVLAGYLGLTYVLTSLFLVTAKITGQDAALAFARGFAALYAGEMLGVAIGNGIEISVGQAPYALVAVAALAVLFAYLFLFTEQDFSALSSLVRAAGSFEEACKLIANEAGLSKREAEILPLALKGRTGERIATEFCIAKSTVDTHLRRIYTKCQVSSRQELIDLGERALQRVGDASTSQRRSAS